MSGRSPVFLKLPKIMLHCAVMKPAQHSDTVRYTWMTLDDIKKFMGLWLIEVKSETSHNTGHVSGCKGTRRYDKGTVQVTRGCKFLHFPTRETRAHKAIKRAESQESEIYGEVLLEELRRTQFFGVSGLPPVRRDWKTGRVRVSSCHELPKETCVNAQRRYSRLGGYQEK